MSCPYTPEQNGIAERKHWHIIETTRTLLSTAGLDYKFWWAAAHTAVYLINRLPSKQLQNLTPYELLYHTPPTYNHLSIFGSLCFPWQAPRRLSKLHPTAPPCIFIGYSPHHKGYRCFNHVANKVILSRHVSFQENPPAFPTSSPPVSPASTHLPHSLLQPISTLLENPLNPPPIPTTLPPSCPETSSPSIPLANTSPTTNSSPSLPTPPPSTKMHPMITRLQTRSLKPKSIFTLQHTTSHDVVPTTFSQANKSTAWQLAMQDEMQALRQQQTWSLVEPPTDHPIIGSKWIFKLTRHPDSTISRYKARLVAQGFHQTYGLDYVDTFSPVATLPTIRMFFITVLTRNWPIQQLDVSNAFLHDTLHEKAYMTQP